MRHKICSTCKVEKLESEFYKRKTAYDGLRSQCKECENLCKIRYLENSDNKAKIRRHSKEYGKQRRKLNPEYDFVRDLWRRFHITPEEYYVMLEKQDYHCALCNKTQEDDGRKLGVDHDHITGKNRGLLCKLCNLYLGDSTIEILEARLAYLKKYSN